MPLCLLPEVYLRRQERLRALLEVRKLPWLVVSNPINIFYSTGFRGSAGVALCGREQARLWVDPRYTLQAREQACGVEVVEERGGLLKAVVRWLERYKAKRVGYEDAHLTCAGFRELQQHVPRGMRLEPAGGLIEKLRYIKGPEEIECVRQAGAIAVAVLEEVVRRIQPGLKEADVAAEIEYGLRRKGAEGAAFETIVASGRRGALPHARASSNLLRKGELVILDLGAILRGYVADMTRTVYLGEPGRRVRSLCGAVREAQQSAVEAVRAGVRAGDVDAGARRALARRGLGGYFIHSTGHGVGLDVHEKPQLARGQKTRLRAGCVVTVEPGIYVEGLGGIRIEDTILVGSEGAEILTPASKDFWFIA